MALAERLTTLVKNSRHSATWVAKEAGVSRGYLWQLMNQEGKTPSGDILSKLGKVLGVTTDDLLHDNKNIAFRPAVRMPMGCVRCHTTQDLILVPHKAGDLVHGLLMCCDACMEYVVSSTLSVDFRKGIG